jgi:transposase
VPTHWPRGCPNAPGSGCRPEAAARRKKGSAGGRSPTFDPGPYKQRNCVERCINRLKTWRGIATRYDKRPDSYLAALHLRGAILWPRS